MSVWARFRRKSWDPTAAQREAALRLNGPDGGYVRTYADGTAELRTHERGGLRRYVIHADGEAVLVESKPGSRRYAWTPWVDWPVLVSAVGLFVVMFVALATSTAWAKVPILTLFFLAFGGKCVSAWLHYSPEVRPKKENWMQIGFPEGGAEE